MNCAINEIFGPTIQGEGIWAGIPSIFVRFNGCNLRCCFRGGSICDTAYTSHNPEKPKYTKTGDAIALIGKMLAENLNVRHIVFTGGEPMLQQDAMADIIDELNDDYELVYTVETNGTMPLTPVLENKIHLFSVSPKLSNSCYFRPDAPVTEAMLHHLTSRINHSAVISYLCDTQTQLKFVFSDEQSVKEIREFEYSITKMFEYLPSQAEDHYQGVLIMPEGETNEQLTKSSPAAVEACIKHGWRFCDRTHIRIWDNKRAV